MIDMNNLPAEVINRDLPVPNVYFATITSATHGTTHMYVAADFSGAALRKVQNHCAEQLGFRPNRANSNIRLRRYRLGDYLAHPQGLQDAVDHARLNHEHSTVKALEGRQHEVNEILAELTEVREQKLDQDFAAFERALGEALRSSCA